MKTPLSLFAAYGIEIEYMIVNRHSLNVMPVADRLMQKVAGQIVNEVEQGKIAWSNELVMHVIELKTNGPTAELETLPALFLENIRHINTLLDDMDACLMPTAMHPWMNPYREKVLWPHDSREIYDTYDRIFNCEGHGWCNLQSMHINLPFANDSEFARLHAAIRILLPILPALAASSPIVEGRVTSILDTRLETYRVNSIKIPSITGQVIPEPIISGQQYQQQILAPMYRDIAPFDP
ncbi:MAG: gamma-glutamyl:cysteine ligase YbdK (ATP-grasp superfamily), partial [Bacteroidia bacterium]